MKTKTSKKISKYLSRTKELFDKKIENTKVKDGITVNISFPHLEVMVNSIFEEIESDLAKKTNPKPENSRQIPDVPIEDRTRFNEGVKDK
jgi:hypothetical protein